MELQRNRETELDVVKGLCMLLVVCGHCESPFTHWIYLFHVAVFYIVSGYCWNSRHSGTIHDIRHYIWQKIKRLYFPYVLGNGIYVLLNNFFIRLGFYSTSEEFLSIAGNGASYGLAQHYSIQDTIISLIKTFAFTGTQMGGATWFIAVLFIITVGHSIVEYAIKRIGLSGYRIPLMWIFTAILIVGTWLIRRTISTGILTMLCALMISYASYLIGVLLKLYRSKLEVCGVYKPGFGVAAFVILLLMNRVGSIGIGDGSITNPAFFVVVTLSGWVMLMSTARIITDRLKAMLSYNRKEHLANSVFTLSLL